MYVIKNIMIGIYIISGITLLALFILFLVLSNILNNIINQLLKLEYMFQKEYEFNMERQETLEMLKEDSDEENGTKE